MTDDEYMALTPQQKYHFEREKRRERDKNRHDERIEIARKQIAEQKANMPRGRPKGSKNAKA